MKARFLFSLAALPLVISGCGGNDIIFDDPTDDLMSCIQGTWTVHKQGYPASKFTRTFYPDGTYIEKQRDKAVISIFGSVGITLTQGRYAVVDGLLYESRQKVASARGYDEQKVYQEAASLLASTPITYDRNTAARTTYCGDKHMARGVLEKISENPLTYRNRSYLYYVEKDEPLTINTRDIKLYSDGKADYEQTEFDSDGSGGGYTNYEYEPGLYKYVSETDGTLLEVRTCGYGQTAEECYGPPVNITHFYSYYDRGAALINENAAYYSR